LSYSQYHPSENPPILRIRCITYRHFDWCGRFDERDVKFAVMSWIEVPGGDSEILVWVEKKPWWERSHRAKSGVWLELTYHVQPEKAICGLTPLIFAVGQTKFETGVPSRITAVVAVETDPQSRLAQKPASHRPRRVLFLGLRI
jgi:hypothetical protein